MNMCRILGQQGKEDEKRENEGRNKESKRKILNKLYTAQ
jgi:hypothetical protein